jgi:mutator protein MutT
MIDGSLFKRVHVAVGVIVDAQGRVLVARRAHEQHLGGLWEFPGGKLEPGERAEQALYRELKEELAIEVNMRVRFVSYSTITPIKQCCWTCGLWKASPAPLPVRRISLCAGCHPHGLMQQNSPRPTGRSSFACKSTPHARNSRHQPVARAAIKQPV